MCNLSGLGGEQPEFAAVRWQPFDEVVSSIFVERVGFADRDETGLNMYMFCATAHASTPVTIQPP